MEEKRWIDECRLFFKSLVNDAPLSDISLRCSDGKNIPAYALLLKLRLPHLFEKMKLDGGEVSIDSSCMKHILSFAYSGSCEDLNVCSAICLLETAVHCGEDNLCDYCEWFLSQYLCRKTIFDLTLLANRLNAHVLMDSCLERIDFDIINILRLYKDDKRLPSSVLHSILERDSLRVAEETLFLVLKNTLELEEFCSCLPLIRFPVMTSEFFADSVDEGAMASRIPQYLKEEAVFHFNGVDIVTEDQEKSVEQAEQHNARLRPRMGRTFFFLRKETSRCISLSEGGLLAVCDYPSLPEGGSWQAFVIADRAFSKGGDGLHPGNPMVYWEVTVESLGKEVLLGVMNRERVQEEEDVKTTGSAWLLDTLDCSLWHWNKKTSGKCVGNTNRVNVLLNVEEWALSFWIEGKPVGRFDILPPNVDLVPVVVFTKKMQSAHIACTEWNEQYSTK